MSLSVSRAAVRPPCRPAVRPLLAVCRSAAPGSSDDARLRHLTLALSPHHAARLFDAQAAGASEGRLCQVAAEALGEVYFRDDGRRAAGLEVELTDVEDIRFEL